MSTVELLQSAFVWSEEVCRSRRTLSTLATVSETAPNEQNSREPNQELDFSAWSLVFLKAVSYLFIESGEASA